MVCPHESFKANVNVGRLSREEGGPITSYMAEIRIRCVQCDKEFQFLGLEPGVDLQGARVDLNGLEARIAICPQGEKPSPLTRMMFDIKRTM